MAKKNWKVSLSLNPTVEPMLPAHWCLFWLWNICSFVSSTKLKMAYLLMFVTLLHLITLAMLFIATMEKVKLEFGQLFFSRCANIPLCLTRILHLHLLLQSWWEWEGMQNSDLWYNCRLDNSTGTWLCASAKETGGGSWHLGARLGLNLQTQIHKHTLMTTVSAEWLQAVQVLMVLSVVFSSVSFLVFLGQLFTMSKGGLFYFTGLCQVFAGSGGVTQCDAGNLWDEIICTK